MQVAIIIMQIVCLVMVIVAIVYLQRARNAVKNTQDNLGRISEYQRKVRTETEAKFQKIELTIASIRDQINKVQKGRSKKRR